MAFPSFPKLHSAGALSARNIQRTDDDGEVDAWGKTYLALQREIRGTFHAGQFQAGRGRAGRYVHPQTGTHKQWRIKSAAEYFETAKTYHPTVRVYFLPRYIHRHEIKELVSCVPLVCTGGDTNIVTQDGQKQASLAVARQKYPLLISNEKRRRSRMKCIASVTTVFAWGGYGKKVLNRIAQKDAYEVIVVSAIGPQFERDYLDFADFIIMPDKMNTRLECYAGYGDRSGFKTWADVVNVAGQGGPYVQLSPNAVFDRRGYLLTLCDSVFLWFRAFDDMVRRVNPDVKGVFSLAAVGCGHFAHLPTELGIGRTSLSSLVTPLLLEAVYIVLSRYRFPNIGALVWNDHTRDIDFCPGLEHSEAHSLGHYYGIEMMAATNGDVLWFGDLRPEERERTPIYGTLNPSDGFALPGNEMEYASVEAMIG